MNCPEIVTFCKYPSSFFKSKLPVQNSYLILQIHACLNQRLYFLWQSHQFKCYDEWNTHNLSVITRRSFQQRSQVKCSILFTCGRLNSIYIQHTPLKLYNVKRPELVFLFILKIFQDIFLICFSLIDPMSFEFVRYSVRHFHSKCF